VVKMKSSSGMDGYGNPQCVSSYIEQLGEVYFFGHNQGYHDYDVLKIVEHPEDRAPATRIIGDHWCEVAASRMRAGEDEAAVMRDYGYMRDISCPVIGCRIVGPHSHGSNMGEQCNDNTPEPVKVPQCHTCVIGTMCSAERGGAKCLDFQRLATAIAAKGEK
jgi:hypothetical protein